MERLRPGEYETDKIPSSPNFIGPTERLSVRDKPGGQNAAIVRFPAGSHTKRHRHGGGQLLIVVEGRGFVETDQERIEIGVGDVIVCPPGEMHRHGALPDSAMAHVTIASGEATWYDD